MSSPKLLLTAAGLLLLVRSATSGAGEPVGRPGDAPTRGQFLRLVRDAKERPLALEAAIVRYAPANRVSQDSRRRPSEPAAPEAITVDLVAAVHIADRAYFERLNREFRGYDVVLYELVTRHGARIPKGGLPKGDHPISAIQRGLKDLLELEFQLDQVDYTRPNFVHADMSPEQFGQSMRDRGESVWDIVARMFGYALAKQGQGSGDFAEIGLLMALFNKNRALALKRILAEQFEEMDGMIVAIDGPNGSTLIAGRNKTALETLRKQIAAGKRKIAIFYGAGHMGDFQNRLREDFGLVPVRTRWLVAWDLKGGSAGPPATPPR